MKVAKIKTIAGDGVFNCTVNRFKGKIGQLRKWTILLTPFLIIVMASAAFGQKNADCLDCHGDSSMTTERDGKEVSIYIDPGKFKASMHADLECITCHEDLKGSEFPHKEKVDPVKCGQCHSDQQEVYDKSLHGQLVLAGATLAPRCWDCHGSHDILKNSDMNSKIAKLNIPFVCGRCHKEGTAVTQTYDIPEKDILTHYSESIHGEGLFKKGLTVTAVCVDCHTAHSILSHLDPKSSIFYDNIPKTCLKCHGQIEKVHKKIVQSQLWEKEPNKVPVCVDCHSPHKARKIFYAQGMADQDCLNCHDNKDLKTTRDGVEISLYVDPNETHDSIHRTVACAKCHTGATPSKDRSCKTINTKVDCAICHTEVVSIYKTSIHGKLSDRGDAMAPTCIDCHGKHGIKDRKDPLSKTYPLNVPELCAQCH